MAPKKAADPPPQSDESFSEDVEEESVRRKPKKAKKAPTHKKVSAPTEKVSDDPEEELKKAADRIFDGSDGEDDDSDLFSLRIPPKPDFLVRSTKTDRLMIMNVEVENFKSYFGKASIGPFHKSFTSIIGPNGSGKSNLIDSLLFVFGFRASKIRSTKVANLIHESAGRRPNSCTVTIHFQRIIDVPGHYEIVKDSAFEISRTAFRNNTSAYAIDGRTASKPEVEARLRQVDIDIEHNRFLILQGEVEQIAMMKPVKQTKSDTGMVEYLEDIVGSNRLEAFVKRFQRRVNRLHCEQSQQRISRDHARKNKVAMEPQVKQAVEYLVKENEAATIQMKLDQRRRQKYLDKVAPKQAELDKKREELRLITEKMDANKTETSNVEEEEKRLKMERIKIDGQVDQITKEISDLDAEEKRRKESIKRHETDISKTSAELEKEEKKKQNFIAVPEKAEKKIQKLKEEREKLVEEEKTANKTADDNAPLFDKEKEKVETELKAAQENCTKCSDEYNKINSEAMLAKADLDQATETATSGKKKLDSLKEQLKSLEEDRSIKKASLEKMQSDMEQFSQRKNELEGVLPGIREEYARVNRNVHEAEEQLITVSQRNEARNMGDSKFYKRLRQEVESGRIPSYIGRLGELGVINKKYEAAICTNFGYCLNLSVFGRSDDAVKMIDIARKERLGRINTISLDKLRQHKPADLMPPSAGQFPGPRIFDLIECEPEFKNLMFDQFRNTIVAESTREAIQWNKHFRGDIVSIDGSKVSPNGNVTGGGNPARGLMLTDKNKKPKLATPEDKAAQKKLEEDVQELKQQSTKLKEQLDKLSSEQNEIRYKLTSIKKPLEDADSSLSIIEPQIENLKRLVEVQEEEVEKVVVDAKVIEEKEKVFRDLEKKRAEAKANAAESKKRQEEVEGKVDEIYKELVGRHKQEANEAVSKRQKVEKDIAKEQASVTNSGRNIAKCDDNIARLEKDIEKKRRLCEELQEKAIDEEMLTAKKSSLDELKKKSADIVAEQNSMAKKFAELVEADGTLEKEKKAAEGEVESLMDGMAADKHKVKELDKKLDGLRVNRVPRFQFLTDSSKPEDLTLAVDDMPSDEYESPEKTEKNKKQMASTLGDQAYAMEYGLRQDGLGNIEAYDNIGGDKIHVELLTAEQVAEITDRDVEQLKFDLKNCEQQLAALKPQVDLSVIGTYVTKVNQYNEQVTKLAEVSENHKRHNERLQQLKRDRLEEFHSAFEFIGKHLVAVYKMLTDGGDAKLEYIDKDDPFKEGISFMVRPAKKAWKQIQFLSGGEKTLSSLALIFALHMFRPTPFYVMDEIDAALDYRNVSIIAQYIRQKTENAQFIIISLRNNMFELANRLVGIYKVDGCTKNVAIDPEKVCEMAKTIAASLGQVTCTLPHEVTQRFNETTNRDRQRITANEKQYANFPSTNEISKAEKIVSVEGRVRKEFHQTDDDIPGPSRSQSKATTHNATDRPVSTRPDSRGNQMRVPNPRLVERSSTLSTRSPRKERNVDPDDTTPPVKRSASSLSVPTDHVSSGSPPRNNNQSREEERGDSD